MKNLNSVDFGITSPFQFSWSNLFQVLQQRASNKKSIRIVSNLVQPTTGKKSQIVGLSSQSHPK